MERKVLLALMLAMTSLILLGCPNPATPAGDTVINIASILGVTAPAYGATPVTTITETAQYTGTVSWNGMPVTFAASTVYTATITLTTKAGYTLTGVAADFFTVAGATNYLNPANSGVVTAVFPATGAATASVISIAAIPGVTAPAYGATPITTITETAQYTGTVAWNGTPATFAASTVYTATITLTAKAGYTLTGVAANFFTVAGATSDSNPVNSGVVTAVFPATGSVTLALITVPAGRFQRSHSAANISVITHPYRMSQHEITRSQFLTIMGTDPSDTDHSSGINDPVQRVNWFHAIAFCNKLSIAEGLTPVYEVTGVNFSTLTYAAIPTIYNAVWQAVTATWTNNGYRLPTEMEWKWAAMGAPADGQGGGTNTTSFAKGYAGSTEEYSFTNNIGNYAWYGENSSSKTHPVGTKIANELGLYDMSGNVSEWNWDSYNTEPYGTVSDYRGPASGSGTRLSSGGGRDTYIGNFCLYERPAGYPYSQNACGGFRVVRP